jgi:hypothetical protein
MKVRFSKWVENGIEFVSLGNNGISSLLQLVVKHIINAEERRPIRRSIFFAFFG